MNVAKSDDLKMEFLSNPELYINRELSQLEFTRRVIAQSKDGSVPLLAPMLSVMTAKSCSRLRIRSSL